MAEAEDQAETSRAAEELHHHHHHLHQQHHLLLLSGEQEESSRGEDPEEFDQEQGERIWVREDKVYPSLQRYLACRNCDNCNRDVELVDMMILKHGGKNPGTSNNNNNNNNNALPPAESGSTCSDSDPAENLRSRLQKQSSNQSLQLIAPPPVPSPRVDLPARSTQLVRSPLPPPPPPEQHVCCVFCGSETRFEHYNNHKLDQPRYRCIKCKQRFTNGGKLRNKRLKLCSSNSAASGDATTAASLNESCEPT